MPSLVTLPRELLDKIVSLVITSISPAPQDISDASSRTTFTDFLIDRPHFHSRQQNVLYAEQTKRSDTLSLLLVSGQLHNQTLAALRVLQTKHSYILDVIIAKEKNLWPTWLSVPQLTTRVDTVYTKFRSLGFPTRYQNLFSGIPGWPPLLTQVLYNLIERFLRVGPVGRQIGREDKRISIKELVIDVLTPNVSPETIAPQDISPFERGVTCWRHDDPIIGARQVRHPKSIAAYICANLKTLLGHGGEEFTHEYACLIYERVGSIKVLVDGQPFNECRSEWDLAKDLAEMKYHDENASKEERDEFLSWKESVYNLRVEFGLPAKPNVITEGKV